MDKINRDRFSVFIGIVFAVSLLVGCSYLQARMINRKIKTAETNGFDRGFDRGAIAVTDGEATVVDLPNGDRVVVRLVDDAGNPIKKGE